MESDLAVGNVDMERVTLTRFGAQFLRCGRAASMQRDECKQPDEISFAPESMLRSLVIRASSHCHPTREATAFVGSSPGLMTRNHAGESRFYVLGRAPQVIDLAEMHLELFFLTDT